MKNLSLNFGLMLTKTSLVVFFKFLGQLEYIVMSDSRKNQNIFFLKKRRRFTPFLVAKSEKTYKKYFSHQPVLVRNGFLNRGPFAEVESTIRPLPLVRLIKSAVAPLLLLKVWSSVKIRGTRVPQNAIVPVGRPRAYSIIILNMRFIPKASLIASSQITASSYILERHL